MLKNGGGAIVNQSSITGSLTGNPGEGVYAATKGGVDGLTKTAALEVAKYNISINAIAACGIDAPGDVFHQWMEKEKISPEAGRQFVSHRPDGQGGRTDGGSAVSMLRSGPLYCRPPPRRRWRMDRAIDRPRR